jgi:hypothetical protein
MKHLLPQVPRYFKTALHCHTNISDGLPSPAEMKEIYKSKGYQVLSITDHNILVDHSAMNEEDFLLLTGVEYNINEDNTWAERRFWVKTYHLNFIAKRPDLLWQPYIPKHPKEESRHYLEKVTDGGFPWEYPIENINAMIAEGNRQGFLVMYNHPNWSLQDATDYGPLEGLWAMEICNYDSAKGGFLDRDNSRIYREMVNSGKRIFPVASDDAHSEKSAGGGWVMVGAEKLEYGAIMDALERGDFYASCGPELYEVSVDDGVLTVRCSDAQRIVVDSGTRFAKAVYPKSPDKTMRSGSFNLKPWLDACEKEDDPRNWIRVSVVDAYGNFASTRAFYAEELK